MLCCVRVCVCVPVLGGGGGGVAGDCTVQKFHQTKKSVIRLGNNNN